MYINIYIYIYMPSNIYTYNESPVKNKRLNIAIPNKSDNNYEFDNNSNLIKQLFNGKVFN